MVVDYDDDVELANRTRSDSPTSQAITACQEYARAHLPRLVEEALEATVAEQTQPIEESLRKALSGNVRDCQNQVFQNFSQHRSSNLDDAGVQSEALPSFDIEPLDLTDESLFTNLNFNSNPGQEATRQHLDSGYASGNQSLDRDSSELLGDRSLQHSLGLFSGATSNGSDFLVGNELMLEDFDWAPESGKNDSDYFFNTELWNESV